MADVWRRLKKGLGAKIKQLQEDEQVRQKAESIARTGRALARDPRLRSAASTLSRMGKSLAEGFKETAEPKPCPGCGQANSEKARFCVNCGHSLQGFEDDGKGSGSSG